MRIGILGSGLMGGKVGTLFARADHEAGSHGMFFMPWARGWRIYEGGGSIRSRIWLSEN